MVPLVVRLIVAAPPSGCCYRVGSVLKDRRLVHVVGDTDRDYQARVPAQPRMTFGPLARPK